MDEQVRKAIRHLRKVMTDEKNKGDELMRQPWSDERDSFANQSYYAADVLEDAINEVEEQLTAHSAGDQRGDV